ncbi:MAG: hypothetical protein KKA19_00205 [Candidatus Margulisbacteria bacterium]|nr:hypothetical protein [Candidatus Margulisiibacteriota bacterium]
MLKFNIRRKCSLIAGDLHGEFTSNKTIEFKNELSLKDLSGLIRPQDDIEWLASAGSKYSAVIQKVTPLFQDNAPIVGKGVIVTIDREK